ncbi:MAG: Rieske 2Fe-2S domain-containing protein [Vallitaleaceae bacterium]|jgi:3-phenylpropionate/trans-cinnamate dioxygenase ferredoxin subunit|nr:Rieske 2Fe-2S domain-containing protein [Vallitaleaceae bacterium]
MKWHKVILENELELDELVGITVDSKKYVVYHIKSGFYATDGECSHEHASFVDAYVADDYVECPKHNGRFHIPTGKALRRPACIDLNVYPVKIEGNYLMIGLE